MPKCDSFAVSFPNGGSTILLPLCYFNPCFFFYEKKNFASALVVVTGGRRKCFYFVFLFFDPGGRPLPRLLVVGAGAGSFRGLPRPRLAGAGICPSSSKVFESVKCGLSRSMETHSCKSLPWSSRP